MTRFAVRNVKLVLASSLALGSILCIPSVQARDPRLVEQAYDPDEVVRIEGKTSVQATIAFGKDEFIENVAIGDSGSWQVTPNKRANLLFVKPLAATAVTNMTVITNVHTYLFDLVANPKSSPLYVLRFTYPEDEKADEEDQLLAYGPNAIEEQAASDPYAVQDPDRFNFSWKTEGDVALLPSKIYDDGEATFLSWPAGQPIPAILITNQKKIEGPVNYAVRGDTIVVDGVPKEIILRSGDDMAILTHQRSDHGVAVSSGASLALVSETE